VMRLLHLPVRVVPILTRPRVSALHRGLQCSVELLLHQKPGPFLAKPASDSVG
jgi:hypothetical protein